MVLGSGPTMTVRRAQCSGAPERSSRGPHAFGLACTILLVCLGSILVLADEAASPLRGRVEVRRERRPTEGRPAVAELGAPRPRERVDRRQSIVYLETAPQSAFESPPAPGRAVLDQRDETFLPFVLAVRVGTTVSFTNSDSTYHNVFSLSKARRFDLGRYPKGESRSVRFDQPGVVRVFCEIHSHMNAFILVFAHRFFASTDAEGRFAIDDVPPGTYTVAVWNEGSVRARRTVLVPDDTAKGLDFVLE